MNIMQWIAGVICGIITLLLIVYVSFAIRQKGPVLTNTYLWSSDKEKKTINKAEEYHIASVVFSCLAVFFRIRYPLCFYFKLSVFDECLSHYGIDFYLLYI